jgi:hypothetical protein
MKITVGQLKSIIRETVGDLQPTTDLQDITTPREKKNGTTTLQDPVTGDVYKTNPNGYVRMYKPDWELRRNDYSSTKFQEQLPRIVHAPRTTTKQQWSSPAGRMMPTGSSTRGKRYANVGDMQAAMQASLEKYVEKRRASLKQREAAAAADSNKDWRAPHRRPFGQGERT